MFNRPTILLADTKIIQGITTSRPYDFNKLFNAPIVMWKAMITRQRKMMNPAFTHNNVKVITV